ncbi:diacylglycerol O-acyltransferase 1 [Nematocida minor]|uniref:diacylglycerol O-acyltransferase 1 n=1 Tax=Nematocida minor TaxID=1912983 RepID=UPI00221F90A9|nr:diacylglycerol O-acyltransferase 1 [Nematocida minor]KAI5192207.1 diacylglycerol O-acyltransferase 1 [Nematocida minor]
MDRVHSKCAHFKHTGIADAVEIGRGGWMCILLVLLVANYKAWQSEYTRTVFWMIFRDITDSVGHFSVLSLVSVNVLRWILISCISSQINSTIIYSTICAGIALEGVIYLYGPTGFMGVVFRYLSLSQLMKGISYLLTKREIANIGVDDQKINKPKKKASLLRFIAYPTLCYQQEYPVSESISVFMLVIYSLMLFPFSLLAYICLQIMCCSAASKFWSNVSFSSYVDVFIWSNAGWFSGFIFVFVAVYGLQSEVTKFGDRVFFEAWWNATISEYWRKWNCQVYRWIKRHVHRDLIKRNITSRSSKIIIFMVSGAVHEYIIGDVLTLRGIGFLTMVMQIPLESFIKLCNRLVKLDQHIAATVVFNVIGAPLLVLLSVMYKNTVSTE